MISLEDLIALSGLTEEEILAIAEHEHLSEPVACGFAQYLSAKAGGFETVRDMIVDDIRHAQTAGDKARATELLHILHHFLKTHPDSVPKVHPWSRVW